MKRNFTRSKVQGPKSKVFVAVLLAAFCIFGGFALRAEDAPAAPVAEGQTAADIMEPGAMAGIYARLGLNADDFEQAQAKPAPTKGKETKGTERTEAKKEEEEEEIKDDLPEGSEELQPEGDETKTGDENEGDGEDETKAAAAPGELNLEEIPETQRGAVKGIQDKVAKLETDLAAATAEAERVRTELAAKPAAPVAIANLHPLMMVSDPQKLAEMERAHMKFEAWAIDNWDGTEAIEARGDQPAVRAFTKEEVRQRYNQVKQEREFYIPKARELLETQRQADAQAKAAYPELFDPKTPESKIAANILGAGAGLAALFPNIRMIIGDAIAGERLRVEKAKAGKPADGKPKAAAPAAGASAAKPAPKLPMTAKPAKPAPSGKAKPADTLDEVKFIKAGGTRDALVDQLKNMNWS